MAIVSHQHQFIFTLNPRTASTATAQAFKKYCAGIELPKETIKDENGRVITPWKHCSLKELRGGGLVSEEDFSSYFKFTTARNPFDSLVSVYAKLTVDSRHKLKDPNSWVHKAPGYLSQMEMASGRSFSDWIIATYGQKLDDKRRHGLNAKHLYLSDHFLRFENLSEDLEHLKDRIELPKELVVERYNVTRGREGADYREYYNAESRSVVESYFREELEKLSYEF